MLTALFLVFDDNLTQLLVLFSEIGHVVGFTFIGKRFLRELFLHFSLFFIIFDLFLFNIVFDILDCALELGDLLGLLCLLFFNSYKF